MPAEEARGQDWDDPYPSKTLAFETAMLPETKTISFVVDSAAVAYGMPFFSVFEAVFGISKIFSLRLDFTPPVYPSGILELVAGLGVYPKISVQMARYVRMALMLDLGLFQPLPFPGEGCIISGTAGGDLNFCRPQLFFGATPLLVTLGSKSHHVTLSIKVLGFRGFPDDCLLADDASECENTQHVQIMTIPTVGLSLRLSKRLRLNLEVMFMAKHDLTDSDAYTLLRYLLVPMVGLKITGKRFHGSIGLGLLFSKFPYKEEGLRIQYPFAFPLLSFGYKYSMGKAAGAKVVGSE